VKLFYGRQLQKLDQLLLGQGFRLKTDNATLVHRALCVYGKMLEKWRGEGTTTGPSQQVIRGLKRKIEQIEKELQELQATGPAPGLNRILSLVEATLGGEYLTVAAVESAIKTIEEKLVEMRGKAKVREAEALRRKAIEADVLKSQELAAAMVAAQPPVPTTTATTTTTTTTTSLTAPSATSAAAQPVVGDAPFSPLPAGVVVNQLVPRPTPARPPAATATTLSSSSSTTTTSLLLASTQSPMAAVRGGLTPVSSAGLLRASIESTGSDKAEKIKLTILPRTASLSELLSAKGKAPAFQRFRGSLHSTKTVQQLASYIREHYQACVPENAQVGVFAHPEHPARPGWTSGPVTQGGPGAPAGASASASASTTTTTATTATTTTAAAAAAAAASLLAAPKVGDILKEFAQEGGRYLIYWDCLGVPGWDALPAVGPAGTPLTFAVPAPRAKKPATKAAGRGAGATAAAAAAAAATAATAAATKAPTTAATTAAAPATATATATGKKLPSAGRGKGPAPPKAAKTAAPKVGAGRAKTKAAAAAATAAAAAAATAATAAAATAAATGPPVAIPKVTFDEVSMDGFDFYDSYRAAAAPSWNGGLSGHPASATPKPKAGHPYPYSASSNHSHHSNLSNHGHLGYPSHHHGNPSNPSHTTPLPHGQQSAVAPMMNLYDTGSNMFANLTEAHMVMGGGSVLPVDHHSETSNLNWASIFETSTSHI
jgi:hypothetical protein